MTASPLTKIAALIFTVLFTLTHAQDISWYNTQSSPYSISNAEELKGLQSLVNNGVDNFDGKTILLANDIGLSGNWTPIGSDNSPFRGVFDGQGYTISDLAVNVGNFAGFFGNVGTNGQIKNINIVASQIRTATDGANKYAGGLAGYYASVKPIENCSVKADSVIANPTGSYYSYSGGLVGYAAAVFAILGSLSEVNIRATGTAHSGGLVGYASAALTISNSYASRNVSATAGSGSTYSAGLVGYANAALTISNSYANGNISASAGSSSYTYSAGLVGYAGATLTISNSYASGNVSVCTNNSGCYSGGLVGRAYSSASITNSYASGNVSGYYRGGIFGYYNGGTMTSVYYKSEGASQAAGSGSPAGILGIPSNNLKKKATFTNWDFDGTWGIVENYAYPYLQIYPPTNIYIPINDIEAEYVFDQTYTGSPITPHPKIKLAGTLLTEGTDYTLGYENNKDAGTGKIIITGKVFLETMTFNILPKTLTLTNAAAQNKVYDGTTTATVTGTLEGVVTGDNIAFSTSTFADKNAGTGKAVASNLTLTGTSASNYKLTQPTGLTADITPKPITITLNPKTITLAKSDDLPNFNEYIVYNGLLTGDAISGTTNVYQGSALLTAVPSTPGAYPITLSGPRTTPNYTYSYDNEGLYLVVTGDPIDLSPCTASDIPAQTYTGSQIQPAVAVSVTCETTTLTADNYTIAYGANINASTVGTVVITGKGAYKGTITKTFTINKKALTITGIAAENKTYDGTTDATIAGAELSGAISTDDVSLANHTTGTFASANVGENIAVSINISITGTAADNYSLTQPSGLKANITAKALATDAIQAINAQTYSGSLITPEVTVKDGSNILEKDTDYALEFSSNRNAGTAIVHATGKGNYAGVADATFTIQPKKLADSMIQPIHGQLYTNSPITPDVIVHDGSRYLIEDTDYTVSYSNNVAQGFGLVTVTGKENYTGTATAHFLISEPRHLEDLEIQPIPDQIRTGSPITPVPTIKDGDYELAKDVDYTIDSYTSNVNAGTALIRITGIGLYSGTRNIGFRIIAPAVSSSSSDTPSSSSVEPSSSSVGTTDPSSSSTDTPSSSSVGTIDPSSSSTDTPSSSSVETSPSSSSNGGTPIRLPQIAAANQATQIRNGINLHATSKAVVEVYGLNGNLVSRQNFGNGVYSVSYEHLPKGMYIVKVSYGSEKQILRLPVR
jgi:hypothetical protein